MTETISTERLAEIARGVWTGGSYATLDEQQAMASSILAYRTHPEPVNDPAEWQVEAAWARAEKMSSDTRIQNMSALREVLKAVEEARSKLAPNEYPEDIERASPSSPTVGELEAKLSQTRGAAVNELAVEIDANRTLRAQLAEARKVLEPFAAMANQFDDWQKGSSKFEGSFNAADFAAARAFLASLGEKQDAE